MEKKDEIKEESNEEPKEEKQKRQYKKSGKPRKNKYVLEIVNYKQDNTPLGEYANHKQIADKLNDIELFQYEVKKSHIDDYFTKKSNKLLSNVLITRIPDVNE